MLVELVGLPGSGKTTVAAALDGRQLDDGTRVRAFRGALHSLNAVTAGSRRNFARRAIGTFATLISAPALAWSLFRIRLAACGWGNIAPVLVITFALESAAFVALAARRDESVRVFEEGPVQWMFSLTFGGNVQRAGPFVARFFRRVYARTGVLFCYLQAPAEICAARFSSREQNTSTFDRGSSERIVAEFLSYPFELLVEHLRAATAATVHVVDARGSVAATGDEVLRLVSRSI